jgi:N-acetylglucosaminyldiphosphoundecaprenol N-acetyl-beta-D-mannosaminyltransferase
MQFEAILGVPISIVDLNAATSIIKEWVSKGESNYVCVRDVHGLMRSLEDPEMMEIQRRAGMVTPDGMPLVWIARLRGWKSIRRVCGADLMEAICGKGAEHGFRHFFYGGKDGVAERLVDKLRTKFSDLSVCGIYSPPFRPLSDDEDRDIVETIKASKANVVWVGISTPKQEYWMRDHVGKLPGVTLIGVGAAFDYHSGAVKRAPTWMRENGLEWVHRLITEPRRLWRRYLILAPVFVLRVTAEQLSMRWAGAK